MALRNPALTAEADSCLRSQDHAINDGANERHSDLRAIGFALTALVFEVAALRETLSDAAGDLRGPA
jgi:hypothetical protein